MQHARISLISFLVGRVCEAFVTLGAFSSVLFFSRGSQVWMFEVPVAAVAIRIATTWLRRERHVIAGRHRRNYKDLIIEELLFGLGLFAACFILRWPITVGAASLLVTANFAGQLLLAGSASLLARFAINRQNSPRHTPASHGVVILGTNAKARRVADNLLAHPEMKACVVGFLDFQRTGLWSYRDIPLIGHPRDIERIALTQQIDALVVALGVDEIGASGQLFAAAERMGITVWLLPDLYPSKLSQPQLARFNGSAAMVYHPAPTRRFTQTIKSGVDRMVAFGIMVVGFPMFLLTALAIKIDSRGPVFFKQERMGHNGRRFTLYKFRTMACNAESRKRELLHRNEMSGPVFKIKDDPRITRTGRLLRKYSIDEFPQLMNVLKGDMSLVGPRPPLPSEVSAFEPWQRRKLSVKPGLTCFWQVNGRNAIDFDHWMRLDLEYIDNWSLGLDAKILVKTVPAVLKGTGQ
ncbi:MAG: sugar transferase [Candidatus Zixiibacteriota bacterium]